MRKTGLFTLMLLAITVLLLSTSIKRSPIVSAYETPFSTADSTTVYLPIIQKPSNGYIPGNGGWPTIAGNSERTSWTTDEFAAFNDVEWYRPIEAYIPQNVQIIASNGFLFISTASGLYALNAENGDVAWRFDTEMPLGNSPTIHDGVAYVGGFDRKLYALSASNGHLLWSFDEAKAGYTANPLVVNNEVIIGNRDGHMYAVGAHGSSQQGQLLWKYDTNEPIFMSAAHKDGVVYFATNDNYAYALNANTGSFIWKSARMPSLQFQSYWPVIFRDKVVFTGAYGYRDGLEPGTRTLENLNGNPQGRYLDVQLEDIFPEQNEGATLGPQIGTENGYPIIDASRLTEYLEDNPATDPHKYKPWRRIFIVLNRSNGSEYTFDSDGDSRQEYLPGAWWGAGSGNRYPPIVGPDNKLYFGNIYRCCSDEKGQVMGWDPATPDQLVVKGGFGALAEPQAISGGGNTLYRNLCCDRVGDWFSLDNTTPSGGFWSYDLDDRAPGYDTMWNVIPGLPRLWGWYQGNTNSVNAAYHNHGDQNPIVPYDDKAYVHRSNAIIAFGAGSGSGQLPMVPISPQNDNIPALSDQELTNLLEEEIQKIVDAGHLRPGYYNVNQFSLWKELADYFDNPGDTIHVLSIAYPHLSPTLQTQVRSYLQQEFNAYFNPTMYASMGWSSGAARESADLPPEIEADLSNHPPNVRAGRFSWEYPPHNFYAMWKYVEIFPDQATTAYNLAKSKLVVPVPSHVTNDYFSQKPFELNAHIAGYIGFLELQTAAGMTGTDASLRNSVTNELDRLLQLRVDLFTKDSYWGFNNFSYKKQLDIARNFIWLVPELGDYMRQNKLTAVQEAIIEYEAVAPYWFVARYEAAIGESVMSNLYNYHALFLAKALILQDSQSELTKYLDVPAFMRGDLFYIQNLVTAIEAE